MKTNVHGTYVLLEAARQTKLKRFLHVSTDEVYGDMLPEQFALEDSPLRPSSPYAASKAAAEMLVMSYAHTYGLPAVITRASNNYGPYQFPEKLMPLMITNALEHKPLPVYGDGLQQRDWLHVDDHCRALSLLIENGETGEVYNVGNGVPRTNMEVLKTLLQLLERPTTLLQRVTDRPGHDRRYALNCEKLKTKLHWQPKEDFEQGLRKTVEWYRSHPEWVSEVKAGTYRDYYDHHYLRRDETLAAFSNPSVAEQR